MFTISATKIKIYQQCPRHYWWHYINVATCGLSLPSPALTLGEHVHNVLKRFFNTPPDKRTKQFLLWLLDDAWQKKTGEEAGFYSQSIEDEYRAKAITMLVDFFTREDTTVIPFWASDKLLTIGLSDSLNLAGKIDRIDNSPNGLHIIDYKTGKETEDEWQLPIYAVLARRYFKQNIAKISYYYLNTHSWVDRDSNPARESATVARLQGLVNSMPHKPEKEAWVCPDGEQCTHCDYLVFFVFKP